MIFRDRTPRHVSLVLAALLAALSVADSAQPSPPEHPEPGGRAHGERDPTRVGGHSVTEILRLLGAELEAGVSADRRKSYRRQFAFTDLDGDGRHSREEYVDKARYGTREMRSAIFRAADDDGDGFVSRDEYVFHRIVTDEAKAIVQAMDSDADGTVERAEFLQNASIEDRELAREVFDALDADGNGRLPIPEYLKVWGRWARVEMAAKDRDRSAAQDAPDRRPPNTLDSEERDAGWKLLFDGRTTDGWRGYRSRTMPASWKVENGSLLSRPGSGESRGDIITVEEYDDFELVLEWKMTRGGNSGVIYRATEEEETVWQSGPEFQILDNDVHPDGLNPLASAGACYAVFAPAKDVVRPLGQWNNSRIVARGKHVEHWLNGEKLLEYDVGSKRWYAHVKTSKFFQTAYGNGDWGLARKGHIGLQDYGGAIEYRNIKIRPIANEANRRRPPERK